MKILVKKSNLALLILLVMISITTHLFGEDNIITVYCDKEIGTLNRKVFGNNFVGYDPVPCRFAGKEYYGYSDYGAGIWNPKNNESVKEVVDLAKETGITIVRFPGGCGTHHYNWKDTIGKEREHFLYGIDDFLKTCEEIGAEAIITVSYFTGDEKDAADLVEYLNGATLEGAGFRVQGSGSRVKDWAAERGENGHLEPYHVKYFEIGNEVMHGNHRDIKNVLPEEYAHRYLKYYGSMKAVDPSIKIGVVLHTSNWNRKVLDIVRDKLDFGIIHTYPSPRVSKEKLETMDSKDIFGISLAVPILRDEYIFQETLKLLHENSGRDIPLAITEYNGGFVQEKPVPYRHCLGTALLNADLLRIFMKPEHKILMANYWQFVNEYWGMIANRFNGNCLTLNKPYYKRPNFYVYNLYKKHFGDVLLEVIVKADSYDLSRYELFETLITRIKTGTVIKNNLLNKKWVIKTFPGAMANEKDGVLVIDFKDPQKFNYYHSIKKAQVQAGAFYKVSGYIKTVNLIASQGVSLEIQDGRGWVLTHSAADTKTVTGTSEWQYVEVIYKTLPDAKWVNVIARRVGEKGPLKGKALFKDLRLERFIPSVNTLVPYVSASASRSLDGNKIYLMVVNKNTDENFTSKIHLKDFTPSVKGNAWILNGPTIDATNEKNPNNVKVRHKEFEMRALEPGVINTFTFSFEPHSLTAIEIGRK